MKSKRKIVKALLALFTATTTTKKWSLITLNRRAISLVNLNFVNNIRGSPTKSVSSKGKNVML